MLVSARQSAKHIKLICHGWRIIPHDASQPLGGLVRRGSMTLELLTESRKLA